MFWLSVLACTPGDGPTPQAVTALSDWLADPDDSEVTVSLPEGASLSSLVGPSSEIDGHHDVLRVWVELEGEPHWLFTLLEDDQVESVLVIPPAPDSGEQPEPVLSYGEAWNAEDPAEHLDGVWAEDARYVDPGDEGVGVDGLVEVIGRFDERFPRAEILPDSGVVVQGEWVHFRWRMEAPVVRMSGMDFGRVDESGELSLIAGFFGELEPD